MVVGFRGEEPGAPFQAPGGHHAPEVQVGILRHQLLVDPDADDTVAAMDGGQVGTGRVHNPLHFDEIPSVIEQHGRHTFVGREIDRAHPTAKRIVG